MLLYGDDIIDQPEFKKMHEADIELIPWMPGDFSGMQEDASAD